LLKEAGETDSRVLSSPEPNPLFLRFGDSALEFELHTWIADVKDLHAVKSHLCQEIARRFREAGIEIPFPSAICTCAPLTRKSLSGLLACKRKTNNADPGC